jgi:thermitase
VAALLLVAPAWAEGAKYVPRELIVTFDGAAGAGERAAAHRAAGARVMDRIPQINADVVRVAAGREDAALRRYGDEEAVATAERDVVLRALLDDCGSTSSSCFVPSDSDYRREWGLQNDAFTVQPGTTFVHDADIDAPYAWQVTKGSSATRIAVLDTGTDRNHEDLAAKVVRRTKFVTGQPDDKRGHGTHVAGTAAAITDNALGVAGVGFNASLLSVKVLGDAGLGSCSSTACARCAGRSPSRSRSTPSSPR